MASFFSTLGVILLTMFMFGILITIHEFGHYIVARIFNVGIIEFSIGMGPKLFSWKGKKNDFSIRAFPIGGYVNMVGEYGDEENDLPQNPQASRPEDSLNEADDDSKENSAENKTGTPKNNAEEKQSFSKKPIWQRLLVVLAGPAMNIILGVFIMFCMVLNSDILGSLTVHSFNYVPSIGYATSDKNLLYVTMTGNTDEAGFIEGDVILKTSDIPLSEENDEDKSKNMFSVENLSVEEAVEKFGTPKYVRVMRKNLVIDLESPTLPDTSGLAISGNLQPEDTILEVNENNVNVYTDMAYQISRHGIEPISMVVERDGEKVEVENVIFPMMSDKGVLFGEGDFVVYRKQKTVGNLLHEAFFKSMSTVEMTITSVTDTFTGRYGIEALSGPIGIGEQVGDMVKSDFPIENLLTLMVLVSLSLGVCNLLPLPVLDGGRVVLFAVEAVRGKPLNPKIESAIMTVSMIAMLALMVFVAFKDFVGLI